MSTPAQPARTFAVARWTLMSRIGASGVAALVGLLVLVPFAFSTNVVQQLTSLLILALMAAMWNALASVDKAHPDVERPGCNAIRLEWYPLGSRANSSSLARRDNSRGTPTCTSSRRPLSTTSSHQLPM